MTFNDNSACHRFLSPVIRVNLTIFGVLLFLVIAVPRVVAKEWRGIVPLKSTNADVERLMGKPNQLGRYEVGNERAYILYSVGPCEALEKADCQCLVAKGTVLRIFVTLNSYVKLSTLGIDKKKYERTEVYSNQPTATYADFTEGVVYTIRESDDSLMNVSYLPSAKDCEAIEGQKKAVAPNVWQGIVPLRSNRADVEQLLGPAKSSHGKVYIYGFAENRVDVSYSADPCKSGAANPRGTPDDVVLNVTVSPRKIVLVQSLNLDKAKYKRIQRAHPEIWVDYLNSAEGIAVNAVLNGDSEEVKSIVYEATARDRELRCGQSREVEANKP